MATNCTYTKNSRYVNGGTTEVDGKFAQWWDRTVFPKDDSDVYYTLERKFEGRPDKLASVFYQDSSLWWLILQYNHILDVNEEFTVGTILAMPTAERIKKDFLNGKSGGVASTRIQPPLVTPIVH